MKFYFEKMVQQIFSKYFYDFLCVFLLLILEFEFMSRCNVNAIKEYRIKICNKCVKRWKKFNCSTKNLQSHYDHSKFFCVCLYYGYLKNVCINHLKTFGIMIFRSLKGTFGQKNGYMYKIRIEKNALLFPCFGYSKVQNTCYIILSSRLWIKTTTIR